MADKVEQVRREEGGTTSELVREAIRRYIEEREWKELLRYGERKAKERAISPEDVERLVEHRSGVTGRRAVRTGA